jgi:hypothetical protein
MSHHQTTRQNHRIKVVNKFFENAAKSEYFRTTITKQSCIHEKVKGNNGIHGHYCDNMIRRHCCERTVTSIPISATLCSNNYLCLKCVQTMASDPIVATVCSINNLGSHFSNCVFQQWPWFPLLQQCFNNDPGSCRLASSWKNTADRQTDMDWPIRCSSLMRAWIYFIYSLFNDAFSI